MKTYEMTTDILMKAGLSQMLEAYGIEPGEDPLRAFGTGRYPAKNDPSKKAALAGMQKAVLIGGPDTPLQLFAGIHAAPGVDAGFSVEPAISTVHKGRITKGFSELLVKMKEAQRPLVIYTQGASYERALSRVTPSLDPESLQVCGEIELAVDFGRVTRLLNMMQAFPNQRMFPLLLMRIQSENATLAGDEAPWKTKQGRLKMQKMLGYKGRLSEEDLREASLATDQAFEVLTSMPAPTDPSWTIAGTLHDFEIEKQKDAAA